MKARPSTLHRPMRHDPTVIARLEALMAERDRLQSAMTSLRTEAAARRQRIENLERELGEAQKAYHLGEGPEDRIHELAGELSRIRELDKGSDLAQRDLSRELGKSDKDLEGLLAQVVAQVDAEVERRRREMFDAWQTELDEFMAPLELSGPGVLTHNFEAMVRNECSALTRLSNALAGAKYDAPRSIVSIVMPDGRLVPSNSPEGMAEARRVERAPSNYDAAAALMRTAR